MAKGMVLKFNEKDIAKVEKGLAKMSKADKDKQLSGFDGYVSRQSKKKAAAKKTKK